MRYLSSLEGAFLVPETPLSGRHRGRGTGGVVGVCSGSAFRHIILLL